MKLQDIIAKIQAGKELTQEEKDFLKSYKEPDANEAEKAKAAYEAEVKKREQAESAAAELKAKIDEHEAKGLSEVEKLKRGYEAEMAKTRKLVETSAAALATAEAKLADTEFKSGVSGLASKHNFLDPEYLAFAAKSKGVKLDDEKAVTELMKGLKESSPALFKVDASAGAGSQPPAGQGAAGATRLNEIMGKANASPTELAEAMGLAEAAKKETAGNGTK